MVEEKGLTKEIAEKIGTFVKQRGSPVELLTKLRQEGNEFLTNIEAELALDELEILFKALEKSKCNKKLASDSSLARGLDYYTGVIFEAVFKGATQNIEKELLERLKKGVYGVIYNYPVDKYNEILDKEVVKDTVSDYEDEEEPMIEYVEGYEELEEEEDMEDFGAFAFREAEMDDDADEMDDDMEETLVVEHKKGRKDSARKLDKEHGDKLKKKTKSIC